MGKDDIKRNGLPQNIIQKTTITIYNIGMQMEDIKKSRNKNYKSKIDALDIYNKGKVGADRFRNDGIVSGNPNYVSDVYENLVVPYLTFQTDSDKITVIDMTNGKRYQCIIYPEISFDEFYEQYILFTNSLQQMESDEMTMSVQAGKVYQKRR